MRGVGVASLSLAGMMVLMSVPLATLAEEGAEYRFSWSTQAPLGDTVAEITMELEGDDGVCEFIRIAGGDQHARGGPFFFSYIAYPDGSISGVSSSAMRNHVVHTEHADLREPIRVETDVKSATVFPAGTWGARVSTQPSEGLFSDPGTYHVNVGGLNLHQTGATETSLGWMSAGIEIVCDKPFTVSEARGSHELLTFSGHSMDGGTGAYESLAVDINMGASESRTFTTDVVRTHYFQRTYEEGAQHGELVWTQNEGTTTFDLTEDHPWVRVWETGAGTHTWELDRISLDFFSSVSGVQYGLDALQALDDLLPSP